MKYLFKKHISWLRNLHVSWFIILMVIYCIVLGTISFAISGKIFGVHQPTTDGFRRLGFLGNLIVTIFIAPMLETLLGQWLPILFVEIFTKNETVVILGSAFIFALGHLWGGVSGIAAGFSYGLILSFSFLTWRTYSKWRAYWVTTIIHSILNSILLI